MLRYKIKIFKSFLKGIELQLLWHIPVVSVVGQLRQEDYEFEVLHMDELHNSKFEASLNDMGRPYLEQRY